MYLVIVDICVITMVWQLSTRSVCLFVYRRRGAAWEVPRWRWNRSGKSLRTTDERLN